MIKAIVTDFDQTLFDTQELKPRWQGCKPDWNDIYSKIPQTQLYEGWQCVRDNLNNLPWGIVSCNVKTLIEKILKYNKMNWFEFIIGRYGEGQKWPRKALPKTELFEYAMQHLGGLDRNEVLYVGDEAADVEQANQYGFQSAACFWGSLESDELQSTKPTYRLNQPTDLLALEYL